MEKSRISEKTCHFVRNDGRKRRRFAPIFEIKEAEKRKMKNVSPLEEKRGGLDSAF